MAGSKGARRGSSHAAKDAKGKAVTIYVPAKVLTAIQGQLEREGYPLTQETITERARHYALSGLENGTDPDPELERLRYLADGLWALSNHAEAFAPELRDNAHWMAMKANLEQRLEQTGVTAFIRRIADERRKKIHNFF